ncbi:capsule associated protein [Grosmannia clavigera kw1407]|uniref:Capsule associated protein n=1 Tax=Grosmannia clavigera (strain kw1407 / UAMH 11150) TaxID=655863 RepID=F0XUD8_GROCL|nr:capsule associated protein [Grosmannia clavigera kw1407]EFW98516.1 capsule associated protein [Grosmannia clavigera kw1407]
MRPRQYIFLFGTVIVLICFYTVLRLEAPSLPLSAVNGGTSSAKAGGDDANKKSAPPPLPKAPDPLPPADSPKTAAAGSHPMWTLINKAEKEMEELKGRQSKTLAEAVTEYRRRYGIAPPPHFDKWFAFAQKNNVQLVDEFDTIQELLTPFWGLKPATTRARAKEALGYTNNLVGVAIRGGRVTNIQGGGDWQREALQGMLKPFLEHLPDMDLCFNTHDEPRVVVPHEDMARLVAMAKQKTMPAAAAAADSPGTLRNSFSTRMPGLNDGSRFEDTPLTRFNVFAHQATWTHSRMSCPPESPARALEEDDRRDDVARYGLGELGFVYNTTALSDVCYTPSLSETFGFFDRPNAYSVVHDLFPIFSQSKVSSYADILYPSPWYWYAKVSYDESRDRPWAQKADQLYWRGSTTGGFSRNGGWRRQHRQRFVQKINAADQALIMVNAAGEAGAVGEAGAQQWVARQVARSDFKELFNVYFSHVGQCDDGDCEAQRQFFKIQDRVDQQDAWQYKHLVDLDGNAFSGRFYAFLQSLSLVYKLAVFREWHYEWLKPWVHYVPLSLRGDDWLEAVRFFSDGALGKKEAERLALQGRDWANKVVRNVDLEAWFFRLLLEYGRVIDDDRETIGFSV